MSEKKRYIFFYHLPLNYYRYSWHFVEAGRYSAAYVKALDWCVENCVDLHSVHLDK